MISDFREDGSAVRKDVLMPKASLLMTGLLDKGEAATAAETCGDGACSLHCLWGSVIPSPAGNMYFCEDARQKLCSAMPVEVSDILSTPCGDAVRTLLESMCSDAVDYCMCLTRNVSLKPGDGIGVGVFWKHLALEPRASMEEFASLKIAEANEHTMLTSALAQACARLFQPSQKDLVRCLCVQLGYINVEDQASLGVRASCHVHSF